MFSSSFQHLLEPKIWMGAKLNIERKEESQWMMMAGIFKDSELAFTNPANKRVPVRKLSHDALKTQSINQ